MMSAPAVGPIARKILTSIHELENQKVVDLAARRQGQHETERIFRETFPSDDCSATAPAFAPYAFVTNWALGLVEAMQEMPELRGFMERIQRAEDEYMPSGPPVSPLTQTYFWGWALWDLDVEHETLGSILLAIARSQGMDGQFVGVLERLVESRLGLHVHEGEQEGRILLRELVTEELRPCICATGYGGVAGELWLARVLPPPSRAVEEHVVVTTPYVIVDPGVSAWRQYLDRILRKTAIADRRDGYQHLMKHGLDERHWSEYVFEAYANHKSEAIFLLGLPDAPESRPHSRGNADRR